MIAELAAFNAGFAVVKQVVANGRDLSNAMGAIGKMISAKEDLQKRGEKKKKSFMSIIGGKAENDFDEFMALEQIRNAEKELESMMKLYGRSGLYSDWIRFQAEARKKRRQEALAAQQARAKRLKIVAYIAAGIIFVGGLVSIIIWIKFLKDGHL